MESSYSEYTEHLYKNNFTTLLRQYDNPIISHQYFIPIETSAKYLKPGSHAFDWSCGNGHFSTFLISKGVTCTGFSFYEIPPHLQEHPSFKFIQGSDNEPTKLPFDDNYFDFIFSIGVLEHVHETGGDQLRSLNEISRILKQDGLFLCFHLPNRYSWIEFICRCLKKLTGNSQKPYAHSRLFTKTKIDQLAESSRFKLIEWGRYNFLPRNITSKLPNAVKTSDNVLRAFNLLDSALVKSLPIFTNQLYFVARNNKAQSRQKPGMTSTSTA